MRAQVAGSVVLVCYLVAAFLPGAGGLGAGPGAAAGGALVKRRGFYAVPGRWVLTWGPGAAGGQLIRVGPWRRGLPRVFRALASGPGAAIV